MCCLAWLDACKNYLKGSKRSHRLIIKHHIIRQAHDKCTDRRPRVCTNLVSPSFDGWRYFALTHSLLGIESNTQLAISNLHTWELWRWGAYLGAVELGWGGWGASPS